MYEHGILSFFEFAAKTATLTELLFVAVQCVSIRLLITSPMAMPTASVAAQSNRKSQQGWR